VNEYQQRLQDALKYVADRLRKNALPGGAIQLERLAAEVDEPCIVAVVGRVKAGKSTFINALLGADLAKVGTTETTATINYFRHGIADPQLPVRCHWIGGKVTSESRQFLDSLQGNDMETLHKADGIDYLEYRLQNSYLGQITLVDTPGTGAVIDEHQNRTADFLHLYQQLRERHDQDTQRIGSKADAVIYLIGEVARTDDQAFLNEFKQVTQGHSSSLNAVGIMAQIDLYDEIIEHREQKAAKIAEQLQDSLNTVIPVSAGIQRALDTLEANEQALLQRLIAMLRSVPSETWDDLLSSDELYLPKNENGEPDESLDLDFPVSFAERMQVKGDMPWRVFTTIARQIIDNPSLDTPKIIENLRAIAGFDRLHKVLDQHFVNRGSLLHSYRIVNDALEVISKIKYNDVLRSLKRAAEDKDRLSRFLFFIQQARSINQQIARELETFVNVQLSPHTDLESLVDELERELSQIKYELEDYNQDFEALTSIEKCPELFTEAEKHELQCLFGLYGLEPEKRLPSGCMALKYIAERQRYYVQKQLVARNRIVREVAEQAERRYGLIASNLE